MNLIERLHEWLEGPTPSPNSQSKTPSIPVPIDVQFDGMALLHEGKIVCQQPFGPIALRRGDSLTATYTVNVNA